MARARRRRRRTTARAEWSRREYLEDALAHYEEMAQQFQEAESGQAAVRAKMQAVAIRAELDELDQVERGAALPSLDDYLDELLERVRRMRLAGEAGGPSGAVAQLYRLEKELVHDAIARRELEKQNEHRPRTAEELLEEAQRRLANLPEALRMRVLPGGGGG